MLPCEQYREQDAGNLLVTQRATVFVTSLHQRLHEILGRVSGAPARAHDPAEDSRDLAPRLVAPAVCRNRQPGEEKPQYVDAVLQFVVGLGKTRVHFRPHFLADQATAGNFHGQLIQRVRQVNSSLSAQGIGEVARLIEHDVGIAAHRGVTQGGKQEPKLLVHDRRGHVVGYPAPEDGHGELVNGLGVQLLLRRTEIIVVCFRSREQDKLPRSQSEARQFPVLAPGAGQQRHRIPVKFRQVAQHRPFA